MVFWLKQEIQYSKKGFLVVSAFLPPPVLKVISCDYVSVHPGLGVMGGVECLRVFVRPFDFLCTECLHQAVVGFP